MAQILEFVTRDEYMARKRAEENPDNKPETALTPQELYNRYNDITLTHCRALVDFYKSTGTWDAECEERMVNVVRTLQSICGILARKGQHGTEEASGPHSGDIA